MNPVISMCEGKARFGSWRCADDCATEMNRKHPERHLVYHCDHCNGFHVGSTIRPRMRPIKVVIREAIADARWRDAQRAI